MVSRGVCSGHREPPGMSGLAHHLFGQNSCPEIMDRRPQQGTVRLQRCQRSEGFVRPQLIIRIHILLKLYHGTQDKPLTFAGNVRNAFSLRLF